MTYRGRVQGGVIVLEAGATLPEGIVVSVAPVEGEENGEGVSEQDRTIWKKLYDLGRPVESMPPVDEARGEATAELSNETIGQKLARLGRSVESMPCDLPSDLAANHDHYLHGLPKRQ